MGFTNLKLLISPFNVEEAKIVIKSDVVDILDVKNPLEGSLGANFPNVISKIVGLVKNNGNGLKISATIGDLGNYPGTASLAALGAATLGLDYIKVGIKIQNKEHASYLLKKVTSAIKDYNEKIQVVAASYADFQRFGAIDPSILPEMITQSGADVAMIDTGIKDGKTLFNFFNEEQLVKFVSNCNKNGVKTALAGSIKAEHVKILKKIGPDIIGVRGAVCEKNDRLNGSVKINKILEFRKQMN